MQFRECWVSPQTPAARITQHCHCCCWYLLPSRRPPQSLLSCPPYFLFLGCPSLLWNGIKRSDSLILRLSFPFLILYACLGSHQWCSASTHWTACCSLSQIVPGFLWRSTAGEYGRMGTIFSFFPPLFHPFCLATFFQDNHCIKMNRLPLLNFQKYLSSWYTTYFITQNKITGNTTKNGWIIAYKSWSW